MAGKVDLHSHTTASDGQFNPSYNVEMAKKAGLAAIAITDHDTIAGLPEAMSTGELLGIEVVPGVEISTAAGGQDIHVLGYYFDLEDEQFLERLSSLRSTRDTRNEMMIQKLRELNFTISMEDVLQQAQQYDVKGRTVGRPHIAQVLVNKGYVSSVDEAFEKYLGKGGLAYVNPPRITPFEAIEWIHQAGGTAVLAHPFIYGDDELVVALMEHGLDGIEAAHPDHSEISERRYRLMAERSGLIHTAGSDFHGERESGFYHAAIGTKTVDADVLEKLRRRRT